ncbi:alpha/beta fold hydrolase [Staphylococcus sp. mip270_02]
MTETHTIFNKGEMIMAWANTKDGLEIYYEVQGKGSPIIFQSGYMGIHDIWQEQVKLLKESYLCITHDNRGYGLSSKPVDSSFYTMEKNAEDLKSVLDANNITEPILLVAHSIGSLASLAFVTKYPQLVKGIIMAGGGSFTGESALKAGGNEEMFAAYQTTPSEAQQFYQRLGCSSEIALEASKWQPTVFKNQTRAMLYYSADSKLLSLDVPVLVIHGKDDVVSTKEGVYEIVENLPNSEWLEMENVNHFPQLEDPENLNIIIEKFIEKYFN